jgi:SAM-dependent methyltransferase
VQARVKRALSGSPRLFAAAHYLERRFRRRSPSPFNLIPRGASAIEEDVEYALSYARGLIALMEQHGITIAAARVLELGPGPNLGPQLILSSLGAEVIVADPFFAVWDPDYHPALYAALAGEWPGPVDALEATIAAGSHEARLTTLKEPAEDLASIPSGSIDFVFSNAVLEHIVDIAKVSAETARVTRPGGLASHTIDLRDHRNFERPLEHIIHGERFFRALARVVGFEAGNRLRSIEFWAEFERAGWRVVERRATMTADPAYLKDATGRLRRGSSPYRRWPAEDLKRIGVQFILRKDESERGALWREALEDRLAVIAALKQP